MTLLEEEDKPIQQGAVSQRQLTHACRYGSVRGGCRGLGVLRNAVPNGSSPGRDVGQQERLALTQPTAVGALWERRYEALLPLKQQVYVKTINAPLRESGTLRQELWADPGGGGLALATAQ